MEAAAAAATPDTLIRSWATTTSSGAGSPARGAGVSIGRALPPDYRGRCYAEPASLGAFETP